MTNFQLNAICALVRWRSIFADKVNLIKKYQPQRSQYWPEVENFFSNLPPQLFQQGVLLKNNLVTFYANTGQFKDILSQEYHFPLLYFHFWLLDDLQVANTPERTEFEKHLFLAMVFTFAAVYTQESILDEGSNFDNSYLFLERALTQQTDVHLARLFSGQSPFWSYHQQFWYEYSEIALAEASIHSFDSPYDEYSSLIPSTGSGQATQHSKLAFSKVPVAAVAISAGQESVLSQLCQMMDHLNAVFQIIRDISTIRLDLTSRRYTYPILKAMHKAGLDPLQSPPAAQLLGALVLTGTIEEIGRECSAHLTACRQISTSLNLPTFSAYWPVVERLVTEITALFNIQARPASQFQKLKRPFFAPAVDTLPKVIEMAEGYLLSDLTFKESWEVQRRGIFGATEVTGKAFPMGLIAEILAQHGHNMPVPIDTVFDTLQATGFRYYDHDHLPPDTDDLGLLLRLYPYSTQPDKHRKVLQTPLRWLETNISPSGEIPVWLTQNKPQAEERFVSLWGQSCAAVEANALLGLIAYNWAGYRHLIEKSAINLFERWIKDGLSATRHYVPLYSLWVTFELIAKLSVLPVSTPLQDKLRHVTSILTERLSVESHRATLTPQDAAFLTLICHSEGIPESSLAAFSPEWITVLAKSQRYDGSWAGEALFGTPTRGELATWYSGRLVTTAFCYHGIKTFQAR